MGAIDIGYTGLALSYLLLIPPLALLLWLRVPMLGTVAVSVIRMTVQLLFVGFYLEVLFRLRNPGLTAGWLLVMIGVADVSVVRGCGLKLSRFAGPLALSLLLSTLAPVFLFVGLLLRRPDLMDPQYVIPISGMVLGNCMRADIIGVRAFYTGIRSTRRRYEQRLAFGATFREAIHPYLKEACRSALTPTVASMATIGLVALPGMMTGVILGGTEPSLAIKYQIAIMLAILCGTAITVVSAIFLTLRTAFDPAGNLDPAIFAG
jgi:putative ABC transport system permease protein